MNLQEDKALGHEEIKEMATIYKKQSSRPLSNYQLRMNEAAIKLCLKNPGLLRKRQALVDAAREEIIEQGFQFVKGKSRSKKTLAATEEPMPKRQKLTQDVREKRLKDIEEDMADVKERISFKEKSYLAVSDYRRCDEIKEETIQLKRQLRSLEAEKKRLATSSRQSKWYYRKKASSSDSGADNSTPSCSDSDFRGHTPTPALSPVSDSSFNDTVVSPCTLESISPDIPPSQNPQPICQGSQVTTCPSDNEMQDIDHSEGEIIYQTPSYEEIISKSSTPEIPLSQYPLFSSSSSDINTPASEADKSCCL